jgi:UMF1 family MFS transporter
VPEPVGTSSRAADEARWLTRPVAAWALYDAASSAYMALVPTFFGLYFIKVIAAGHSQATSWWGVLAALSLVAAGLLAPLVGASADQVNRRIGILAATTAVCCAATVAIPLASQGDLWLAAGLFAVAHVAYTLATAIYDSLLVVVARPRHMGRVSGFGWAVGLAGGIVGLCLAILVVHGVPSGTQPTLLGTVFMMSGLLMAAVATPVIGMMHRLSGVQGHRRSFRTVRASFSTVVQTLRSWRQHRPAFHMLAGFYLINDALVTVVFFVAIVFQKRFGLDLEGLFWLSLLFHAVATPSTFVFGHLADR